MDKDNVIVAGHTRLKAAKKLGIKKVPVLIADDLDENQIKAFRLADNKVSELATWDWAVLDLELDDITLNMEDFGFSDLKGVDNMEFQDMFTDKEDKPQEPKTIKCPHCGEIIEL